jgi:hypothetical protein
MPAAQTSPSWQTTPKQDLSTHTPETQTLSPPQAVPLHCVS